MTPELAEALRILEFGWPGEPGEERLAVYAEGLADVPGPILVSWLRAAVRSLPYRPSIAAVRRALAAEAGVGGPPVDVALRDARALDEWEWTHSVPTGAQVAREARPVVHPVVAEAWAAAGPDAPAAVFTARYREAQDRALEAAAGRDLGALTLGDGRG